MDVSKMTQFPDGAIAELTNLECFEVSAVDHPANRRPWLIVKRAEQPHEPSLVAEGTPLRGALVNAAKSLALLLDRATPVDVVDETERVAVSLLAACGHHLADAQPAPAVEPAPEPVEPVALAAEPDATPEPAVVEPLPEPDAIEAAASEPEPDPFLAILDEATAAPEVTAIDLAFEGVLLDAQVEAAKSEIASLRQELELAQAVSAAQRALMAQELAAERAAARKAAEDELAAGFAAERLALQAEIETAKAAAAKATEQNAALTADLAKAHAALKSAPAARQVADLLSRMGRRPTTIARTHVAPVGEQPEKGQDVWEAWDLNEPA